MQKLKLTLIKLVFLLVFPLFLGSVNAQTAPEIISKPVISGNVSNEIKLKVFGMSTFLHMLKNSANDLKSLNKAMNTKDFVREALAEFSAYSNEINQLHSLENLSIEERIFKIDRAISLIENKLNPSEKWQFNIGKDFGEIVSQFIELYNNGNVSAFKFDEARLKKHLSEIKALCLNAPADFPPDVLERLKDFAAESEKDRVVTAENRQVLGGKLMRLMNAISPGSFK